MGRGLVGKRFFFCFGLEQRSFDAFQPLGELVELLTLVERHLVEIGKKLFLIGDLRFQQDETLFVALGLHIEVIWDRLLPAAMVCMSHYWAALSGDEDRKQLERWVHRAQQIWEDFSADPSPDVLSPLAARLRALDSRLELAWVEERYCIRTTELPAWPLAWTVVEVAPPEIVVECGIPACGHERALHLVNEEAGLDLSSARVRVGMTRGHLLAIAMQVPLDVVGDEALIQRGAELYCEACLGDEFLDQWVVSIEVMRGPRSRGLLVVSDSSPQAPTYPLGQLDELSRRGAQSILAEVPSSRIEGNERRRWTALELGTAPDGSCAQLDRREAMTSCPEELKCALEGLPFDSRRFTRGDEIFVWLSWTAPEGKRLQFRDRAEARLNQLSEGGLPCVLAGTGMGATADYFDLWVSRSVAALERLTSRLLSELGLPLELGFYDSCFAEETMTLLPPEGPSRP